MIPYPSLGNFIFRDDSCLPEKYMSIHFFSLCCSYFNLDFTALPYAPNCEMMCNEIIFYPFILFAHIFKKRPFPGCYFLGLDLQSLQWWPSQFIRIHFSRNLSSKFLSMPPFTTHQQRARSFRMANHRARHVTGSPIPDLKGTVWYPMAIHFGSLGQVAYMVWRLMLCATTKQPFSSCFASFQLGGIDHNNEGNPLDPQPLQR